MATIASVRASAPDHVERLRRHADRDLVYIAILALVPWVLYIVNRSWTYSIPDGQQIDPYIYTGYFQDLKGYNEAFGPLYYGARVPWLLFGSAAYSLLEPPLASLFMRVVLFYVSTLSLYIIVRVTWQNRFAGATTAVIMGTHTLFLSSIGWDYVNGLGIASTFFTMACFTLAVGSKRWPLWLIGAGTGLTTMVSAHIFLLALAPFTFTTYLLLNHRAQKHSTVRSLVYVGLGGVLALVFYSLSIRSQAGEWLYFLPWTLLDYARGSYNTLFTPWNRPLSEWIRQGAASWLTLPFVSLALGFGLLAIAVKQAVEKRTIAGDHFAAGLASLNLLIVAAIYVVMQAGSSLHLVQYWEYTSFIIPFAFVAIGGAVALATERLSPWWRGAIVVAAVSTMLAPYVTGSLRFVNHCGVTCEFNARILLAMVLVSVLLLTAAYLRNSRWLLAAICVFSLLNVASAQLRFIEIPERGTSRELSRAVFDTNEALEAFDPDHRAQIWFADTDEDGRIFRAVASMHLWEFSLLSTSFPELRDDPSTGIRNLRVGDDAIILSSNPNAFREGKTSLNEIGLEAKLLDSRRIDRAGLSFEVSLIRIDAGNLAPAAAIPPAGWAATSGKVQVVDEVALLTAPAKSLTGVARLILPPDLTTGNDDPPGFVHVIGSVEGAPLAFELVLNRDGPRIGQPLMGHGKRVDLFLWTDRLSDVKAVEVKTWNRERFSTARIESVEFLRVTR